jgi:hypothetical protein
MFNHGDGSRIRFVAYKLLEDFLANQTGERLALLVTQAYCTQPLLDSCTQLEGEDINSDDVDILSPKEARREDVMLALRTRRGASATSIEQANLRAIASELVEKGLLEHSGGYYRCTTQGWLLGNIVFSAIWLG